MGLDCQKRGYMDQTLEYHLKHVILPREIERLKIENQRFDYIKSHSNGSIWTYPSRESLDLEREIISTQNLIGLLEAYRQELLDHKNQH